MMQKPYIVKSLYAVLKFESRDELLGIRSDW